jgi:hypothetical protein
MKFRIECVTELFKEVYTAVHEANPNIDFRYNNHRRYPELVGVSFKKIGAYVDSVRDSDYTEQSDIVDNFKAKRNTILKVRRGIGFDKDIIAGFAVRPNATPEKIVESIKVLSTLGVDGFSLGHYDGAHMEHLDAVKQGMDRAGVVIKK